MRAAGAMALTVMPCFQPSCARLFGLVISTAQRSVCPLAFTFASMKACGFCHLKRATVASSTTVFCWSNIA